MFEEGRPLLLVVRETPVPHRGRLGPEMMRAAEAGAMIFRPAPAFTANRKPMDVVGVRCWRVSASRTPILRGFGRACGPKTPPAGLPPIAAMTLATTGADGSPRSLLRRG